MTTRTGRSQQARPLHYSLSSTPRSLRPCARAALPSTESVTGTRHAAAATGMGRAAPPNHRPMSRNRNIYGPAVNIRTHDMLTPQERKFLEAAEQGDRPSLIACLSTRNVPLNVNCVDAMGRTAIEIAVDNENLEIVSLLLQQEEIRIGNALLCAIREGVYRIVEMLVNHPSINKDILGEGWYRYLNESEVATSEYSSDISPIMLAAHLNRFEILQMLLRKEATIERPHKHSCMCENCDSERLNDSLHHSLKRINTYRALASPAWMSLTSSDPILSAFRLSWELQNLARMENEFKDIYLQLAEQCKQFACDLLSQCRSTEEVIAILNKEDNAADENIDVWASKLSLSRLKLAIKYEQKMFVSHPHCQQLLTSIWSEGIPVRQQRNSKWNILIYALLILLWPFLAICYILLPKSRIGRIVRSPFMKFLYYSTSFGCFLILLTLVTLEAYRTDKRADVEPHSRASDRGAPPTFVEALVVLWVLGMFWSEVKQLWEEGLTRYVYQWWNWLDFCMMCLYMCTIALRLSGYLIYVAWNNGDTPRYVIRTYWNAYEPMLVAEAMFAVANVLSFSRIIYLFQISPYLGPLQISLGCMLVDVAKFCFIFVLIISSFAIGLAQLYWYYEDNAQVCFTPENCASAPNVFSSIGNSYMTLLWSLFAITKVEDTDVLEEHIFTQWIGRGLFMMYHITSIIVLLNMLIAMMSHSFQTINDHADLEWKFHRTKLWMAHFDEGSSLPPPFNIIITPKAVYYAFCRAVNTIKWLTGRYHYQKNRNRATIRRPGYSRKTKELEQRGDSETPAAVASAKRPLTYMDIIERLVSRFIHQTKKNMKMDGVNEDDLLEIKQDISSLRYELRDDRRKEIVRSSSHIDAVKRDIMRTMSTSTRIWRRSQRRHKNSVAEEEEEEGEEAEPEEDSDFNDSDSDMKSTTAANTLSPTISISYDRPKRRSYSDALTCPVTAVEPPPSPGHPPLEKRRATALKSAPSPLKFETRAAPAAPVAPAQQQLESVRLLRELLNQKLDQLAAQLTEPCRGGAPPPPMSAPARSTLSPSRVNFAMHPDEV